MRYERSLPVCSRGVLFDGVRLRAAAGPDAAAHRRWGLAPLARTAEVRLSPTVYYERKPLQGDDSSTHLEFDMNDIATHPNAFIAFAFTDSLTMILPLGVLWSPVVQVERGLWLTVGGGVYGFGFHGSDVQASNAAGAWAKTRLGSDFWLMGGVAAWHTYDSSWVVENYVSLIPGVEAGVQVIDAWAVALLADHRHDLIEGQALYSRLRIEHTVVPVWWIDIGVHGGIYLHARADLHVDPLAGVTVTGRW